MTEPFVPDPQPDRTEIAAADPGAGGPTPAGDLGVASEEPDLTGSGDDSPVTGGDSPVSGDADTSFRTPVPPGD